MAEISVAQLFRDTRRNLKLTWVAGIDGGDNLLTSETVTKPSLALIGHLNFVHPNRVQVLGCAEMDYLRSLQTNNLHSAINSKSPPHCETMWKVSSHVSVVTSIT